MSGVTVDDYVLVAPEKQTSPKDDMSFEGYVIIPFEKPDRVTREDSPPSGYNSCEEYLLEPIYKPALKETLLTKQGHKVERPLEAENTGVVTETKPIIHAANTDTVHHPRAPKGPQNKTRGGIRHYELPPTSTGLLKSPLREAEMIQTHDRHTVTNFRDLNSPPLPRVVVQTHGHGCPLSPETPEYVPSGRPDGPAQPRRPSPPYVPTGYIPGNLPSYRPHMSQVQFEMQRQPTRETYYTPSNPYGHVRRGPNPQYYNYPLLSAALLTPAASHSSVPWPFANGGFAG